MFRRVSGILTLLICILSLWPYPAQAQETQTQPSVNLSPPDLAGFPIIQAYLDVRDSKGQFIHNLDPQAVTIIEDENRLNVLTLEEIRPGVQAAFVISPGPSFSLQDSQGVSRYDLLLADLRNWAKSKQGSTLDDWSLLVAEGPRINHTEDPMEIHKALEFTPENTRDDIPNLDSAFQAVELVSDPPARDGMGRIVLWIVPPLDDTYSLSLENLSARSLQQGVRLVIWMVGPDDPSTQIAAERLRSTALKTGGEFFIFNEEKTLPSPEGYFDPLREAYLVTFASQVRTSGVHQISSEVQTGEGTAISPVQTYEINLQPPVPAFILPPLEITREPEKSEEPKGQELPPPQLIPEEQPLQILVDFPDELIRPLTRASLYVDGVLEDQNDQEPFGQFTWDLTKYTSNGNHTIRAEVEDYLGLTGSSIEHIVHVSVSIPKTSWTSYLTGNLPILIGSGVILIGALIFLVFVVAGKLRPFQPGRDRRRKKKMTPLVQTITLSVDPLRSSQPWISRFQWPQRPSSRVLAFMIPLEATGPIPNQNDITDDNPRRKAIRSSTQTPVPISTDELTIGSDPALSLLLLTDPSVEALHARLIRQPDDRFMIFDQGSIAGTWVNYSPVPPTGTILQQGDLVHIGRSGFRFSLRNPERGKKATTSFGRATNREKQPKPPGKDQGMIP